MSSDPTLYLETTTFKDSDIPTDYDVGLNRFGRPTMSKSNHDHFMIRPAAMPFTEAGPSQTLKENSILKKDKVCSLTRRKITV